MSIAYAVPTAYVEQQGISALPDHNCPLPQGNIKIPKMLAKFQAPSKVASSLLIYLTVYQWGLSF